MTNPDHSDTDPYAGLRAVEALTAGAGGHGDVELPVALPPAETKRTTGVNDIRRGVNTDVYRIYGSADVHEHGIQGPNGEHTIK